MTGTLRNTIEPVMNLREEAAFSKLLMQSQCYKKLRLHLWYLTKEIMDLHLIRQPSCRQKTKIKIAKALLQVKEIPIASQKQKENVKPFFSVQEMTKSH